MNDQQHLTDESFDDLARSAGAALRRPAPADGVQSVRTARRRQQQTRAALGGVAFVAVIAVGAAVILRDDPETIVVEQPDESTPATVAPTVPGTSVPSTAPTTAPPVDPPPVHRTGHRSADRSRHGAGRAGRRPQRRGCRLARRPDRRGVHAGRHRPRGDGHHRPPSSPPCVPGRRPSRAPCCSTTAGSSSRQRSSPTRPAPCTGSAVRRRSWRSSTTGGSSRTAQVWRLDPGTGEWAGTGDLEFTPPTSAWGSFTVRSVDGMLLVADNSYVQNGDGSLSPSADRRGYIIGADLSITDMAPAPDGVALFFTSTSGGKALQLYGPAVEGGTDLDVSYYQPWQYDPRCERVERDPPPRLDGLQRARTRLPVGRRARHRRTRARGRDRPGRGRPGARRHGRPVRRHRERLDPARGRPRSRRRCPRPPSLAITSSSPRGDPL